MTKHILASAFRAVTEPLRKRPGPQPKHTAGMARSGELDAITEELCEFIRGKANNVYLTELLRIRDKDVKLLDHTRLMVVMKAYAEQKAKNDYWKRKVEREPVP